MLRISICLILEPVLYGLLIFTHAVQPISPFVLPPHPLPQEQAYYHHSTITCNQPSQRRKVPRSFPSKEYISPRNIASGIEQKPQPVGGRAFSVSSDIGGKQIPRKND